MIMWSVDHLDGGRRGARGLYELIGLAAQWLVLVKGWSGLKMGVTPWGGGGHDGEAHRALPAHRMGSATELICWY